MKSWLSQLAIVLCCLCESALGQVLNQPFASEALDKDLYKQGEIRRFNQKFQNWDVVCDEIIRQKRRFCSLSTYGIDESGLQRVHLTVSTSDEGKPAALLKLPFGIALDKNVEIKIEPQATQKFQKSEAIKLIVPYCNEQGCLTIFGLKPSYIEALNNGSLFSIRFWMLEPVNYIKRPLGPKSYIPVELSFSGNGFKEAIQGSMALGNAPIVIPDNNFTME